jgi:SAM-dependent methyltransferase
MDVKQEELPHKDGKHLYGDDFSLEQIALWYEQEKHGYYNLVQETHEYETGYQYEALNRLHGLNLLTRKASGTCLAFGCARGDDVLPLAKAVKQFVAVEPATEWWADTIGGIPAHYIAPAIDGTLPLDANTIDMAVCLGVLHHIPNVSFVMQEICRVLRPGALLVIREPISSMGDWRQPREGLTANERGLPLEWTDELIGKLGLKVIRRRFCMFSPLRVILLKCGFKRLWASAPVVWIDWLLSSLMSFNVRYYRDTFWKKCAPSSVFYVLQK